MSQFRMSPWRHTVRIKHLLTESEELEDVKKSMVAVADELDKHDCFKLFPVDELRNLEYSGSALVRAVDVANMALSKLYDYADKHRIWMGL